MMEGNQGEAAQAAEIIKQNEMEMLEKIGESIELIFVFFGIFLVLLESINLWLITIAPGQLGIDIISRFAISLSLAAGVHYMYRGMKK